MRDLLRTHLPAAFSIRSAPWRGLLFVGLAVATVGIGVAQTPMLRPEETIWPADLARPSQLGASIAVEDDWVAVTAPTDDQGAVPNAGSVYIFRRTQDGLDFVARRFPLPEQSAIATQRADLRDGILAVSSSRADPTGPPTLKGQCAVYDLEDPAIPLIGEIRPDVRILGVGNGGIGQQVAVLDRDHVAVTNPGYFGASLPNGAPVPSGAVHVYQRGASGWTVKQTVLPGLDFYNVPPSLNPLSNSQARGMDFDGERMVIGGRQSFAIYNWGDDQRLHPASATEGHYINLDTVFGKSVCIRGDLVAVGSWGDYFFPFLARVEVYRETQSGWQREATLFPSDGFTFGQGGSWGNSAFGIDLAIDARERILVGATTGQRSETSSPPITELPGSAYLFERVPTGWSETLRFWDAHDDHGSEFGGSVAFMGDMVLVGAMRAELPDSIRQIGSASLFLVPLGESVCSGEPNSTDEPGTIEVVGDRDVAFEHVEVRARSLPPGASAMLLASRDAAFVPNPGASAGNLCLGGQIARFVGSIGSADASGEIDFEVPGLVVPTPGGPETIETGDSWTFQVWYRDSAPTPTSNFTEARRVEFE